MSARVVELTFEIRDDGCMAVSVSNDTGATLVVRSAIRRSDDAMLEFLTVAEGSGEAVLAAIQTWDRVRSARIVQDTPAGPLLEVVVDGQCVSRTLADEHAVVRSTVASDGIETVVADVPDGVDPGRVADRFLETYDETTLVSKRTITGRIPGVPGDGRAALLEGLTEKQRQVFETAHACGYFEWPRRSSATDCAASLGISQPTFSQHLRRAHQQFADALFLDDTPEGIRGIGPTQ